MFKSSPAYGIWSIWIYLWLLPKFLFLWLCVLGIYSLFFAVVSTRRLRAITHLLPNEGTASGQWAVTALHKRCTTLRQLTRATFYLFGFVLFLCFQWAYMTVDRSTATGEWFVLENFMVYFAFAANGFFVFLIIHCIQWFVSSKVDGYISRFNAPTV